MEILTLFNTTMRGFNIVSIERVQNKALWEVFQWYADFNTSIFKYTNIMPTYGWFVYCYNYYYYVSIWVFSCLFKIMSFD